MPYDGRVQESTGTFHLGQESCPAPPSSVLHGQLKQFHRLLEGESVPHIVLNPQQQLGTKLGLEPNLLCALASCFACAQGSVAGTAAHAT